MTMAITGIGAMGTNIIETTINSTLCELFIVMNNTNHASQTSHCHE